MQINSFKDYVEFTRTTAVYPKDKELEYLFFGLIDEIGELRGKLLYNDHSVGSVIDELSDVCWYTGRLVDNLGLINELDGIDIYDTTNIPSRDKLDMIDELYHMTSIMAGGLKKFIRDGNESKMMLVERTLIEFIHWLRHTSTILGGYNLKNVLEINVRKLSDRKDRGVLKGDGDSR